MQENPERTAWIILSSAFVIFCTLVFLISGMTYWYFFYDTRPFPTELTSVRGVVLVDMLNAERLTSVTDGMSVSVVEGYDIRSDDNAQAILGFVDESSLTMYSDTSITLRTMQEPRFRFSAVPVRIVIYLTDGRIRVTNARTRVNLTFDIVTPHTQIELGQGSFSVEVNREQTQVTSRLGVANLVNSPPTVVPEGKRLVISSADGPSAPLSAARNLLMYSEFTSTLTLSHWSTYSLDQSNDVETTARTVKISKPTRPFYYALELKSTGDDNIHTEVGVTQIVNQDVRDFRSLRLSAELQLLHQSLNGGGQLGSEFPLMLHVAYKDADNNDRDWYHGFYYTHPLENYILYDQPNNASEYVPRLVWYSYESENLLSTLGPAKPVYIKSIRIYASGWIYHALVSNISLLAEE